MSEKARFNLDSARKIADAVRRLERLPVTLPTKQATSEPAECFVALFQTTSDLEEDSTFTNTLSCTAKFVIWDNDSAAYVTTDALPEQTLYYPLDTTNPVYDATPSGSRVMAHFKGAWIMHPSKPGVQFVRFKLYENLVGDTATEAYIWQEAQNDWSEDTIEVRDAIDVLWAESDKQGYAIYNTDTSHWEVLRVEAFATHIKCIASSSFESDDETIAISSKTLQCGGSYIRDEANLTAVNNPFDFAGASGALLYCVWDEDASAYCCYQTEC